MVLCAEVCLDVFTAPPLCQLILHVPSGAAEHRSCRFGPSGNQQSLGLAPADRRCWRHFQRWESCPLKSPWYWSLPLWPETLLLPELARCQSELVELAQLIQRLQWLEGGLPITDTDLEMRISMQVNACVDSLCMHTATDSFGHHAELVFISFSESLSWEAQEEENSGTLQNLVPCGSLGRGGENFQYIGVKQHGAHVQNINQQKIYFYLVPYSTII